MKIMQKMRFIIQRQIKNEKLKKEVGGLPNTPFQCRGAEEPKG